MAAIRNQVNGPTSEHKQISLEKKTKKNDDDARWDSNSHGQSRDKSGGANWCR